MDLIHESNFVPCGHDIVFGYIIVFVYFSLKNIVLNDLFPAVENADVPREPSQASVW